MSNLFELTSSEAFGLKLSGRRAEHLRKVRAELWQQEQAKKPAVKVSSSFYLNSMNQRVTNSSPFICIC